MKVIAIDLGSNTCRVLKYDCKKNIKIAEYEKIVRTANSLTIDGTIDKEAQERVINALLEAKEKIGFESTKIRAVTTQALRVAKNSKEILENIKEKTGIEFEVIDGEKEAKLTLIAVKKRLESLNQNFGFKINKNFVLVDIGGGSTELGFYINGRIFSKSFPLGIVTVANSAKNLNQIDDIIDEKSKKIVQFINGLDFKIDNSLEFIATAGTPTTVAAMKLGQTYYSYDADKINGTILTVKDLDIQLNRLLKMNKKEKELYAGVGRDDLIIAGIYIYKKIFKILNKKSSIIIDDGLREGVAITLCTHSRGD